FVLLSAAFCAKVYLRAADRDQRDVMTRVLRNAQEWPADVVEHARAGTKTRLVKLHSGIAALTLPMRPLREIIFLVIIILRSTIVVIVKPQAGTSSCNAVLPMP